MHIAFDSIYKLREIVEGCKRGNPVWQKVLYEQYYRYAMAVCMRYASNYEDAREVLNDGFVKIFKNISQFVVPDDSEVLSKLFMSWLKKIMINTGINHSISAQRQANVFTTDHLPESQSEGQSPALNLAYEDLVKMIQKLSPSYRNVFNLFVIEGFRHDQIADILHISVGASKSNLLKARRNLRKMLEEIYEEKV